MPSGLHFTGYRFVAVFRFLQPLPSLPLAVKYYEPSLPYIVKGLCESSLEFINTSYPYNTLSVVHVWVSSRLSGMRKTRDI